MEFNESDKNLKQIIRFTCINDNSEFNIETNLDITFNHLYDKIKDSINTCYNLSIDSSTNNNIEIFTKSIGKIKPDSIVNDNDLLVEFSNDLFYKIKEQYEKNINTDLEELRSLEENLLYIVDLSEDQTKSIESRSIFKCCRNLCRTKNRETRPRENTGYESDMMNLMTKIKKKRDLINKKKNKSPLSLTFL